MFTYTCMNAISEEGLNQFNGQYVQTDRAEDADAILLRSANIKEMAFSDKLKVIARAGAGVNNIPVDRCSEEGIVVFNTPGANANGVKELVIAGMLLASRDIVGGIDWLKGEEGVEDVGKLAEKQKKQYAGHEIGGKKLGIIGLGAIGVLVANAAANLGMEVYGYDPYISVQAAWNLSRAIKHIDNIDTIYAECDYITIHVPLVEGTRGMINAQAIASMKDNVVILNYARDLLVDEHAMISALESGKVAKYVTDFPNPTVIGAKNTIVTPHLGASTAESEDNCARMAAREVRDFLENGNITNSVNYPNCDMGTCKSPSRVALCHRNQVNLLSKTTKVLGKEGLNITEVTNKSKGKYAYTLVDLSTRPSPELVKELEALDGVLSVRIVK